jgi:chlorobactene glucosyltransferase
LRVIHGEPLPAGWLGKHWANHQLAQSATGDLLLFTDADTRHSPKTLREAVSALLARRLDLLTAFPREEMLTWGERLTVPILSFSIFCFFPMLLATKLRLPALTVTIGQFMLFRRPVFEAIGGYAAVRGDVVDDVMLGRRTVAMGFTWQLMDGTRHISCRMYSDFSSAWEGFTKNLFALFDYRVLLYSLGWFWIGVSFLLPPLALVSPALGRLWNMPPQMALIAVSQALAIFALAYYRFRFPMYLVLLYPLNMLIFLLLAGRSLLHTVLGYSSWKGRDLPPPTLRF